MTDSQSTFTSVLHTQVITPSDSFDVFSNTVYDLDSCNQGQEKKKKKRKEKKRKEKSLRSDVGLVVMQQTPSNKCNDIEPQRR